MKRIIICVSYTMVQEGSELVHGAAFTHACSRCGDAVATAPAIQRFIAKELAAGNTIETTCIRCLSDEERKDALEDGEILPEVMAELIAHFRRN